MGDIMTAIARYVGVSIDSADPAALADFYRQMLGLEISYTSDEFVFVGEMGPTGMGFVKVDDYQRPTWPSGDVPKQAHMEFGVDDLDKGEAALIELGASKPEPQPQPDRWRVLLDPAGHPFCISVQATG
jgi:catechol 2,3-dioxygenase-like lactoylglutathione lyase family enzyme